MARLHVFAEIIVKKTGDVIKLSPWQTDESMLSRTQDGDTFMSLFKIHLKRPLAPGDKVLFRIEAPEPPWRL